MGYRDSETKERVRDLVIYSAKSYKEIKRWQIGREVVWDNLLPTPDNYLVGYSTNSGRRLNILDIENERVVTFFIG